MLEVVAKSDMFMSFILEHDGRGFNAGATLAERVHVEQTSRNGGMRSSLCVVLALIVACAEPSGLTVGDIEFRGPPGSSEPSLHATSDGRFILTWQESIGDTTFALKVAVREAGVWSEPVSVIQDPDLFVNWADFPSLVETVSGTWIVHWLEKVADDPYAYHVKLALSEDHGRTWSGPIVPHEDRSNQEHGFVSMVPFGEGVALVWLDGRGMGTDGSDEREMSLRATTLSADGALGEDILLDGRTCECCQTALVRSGASLVAAYRDRSLEEIRDISVVRLVAGEWSEPAPLAEDDWYYPGCPVNGPQLSAAGDTLIVTWFTAPENEPAVYAAYSYDVGASFGPRIRIDDGDPLGRVDVEFVTGGKALVVWLERTTAAAEIRARLIYPSGEAGDAWSVAETSESRASGFPRLASSGGEVLLAWTLTGEGGGVRVASLRLNRTAE